MIQEPRGRRPWTGAFALIGLALLGACSSSSSGGDSAPSTLAFASLGNLSQDNLPANAMPSPVSYGMMEGGVTTRMPYPVLPQPPLPGQSPLPLPAGGTPVVNAATFPSGAVAGMARQDYIQIEFGIGIVGSTIQQTLGAIDGIVLLREDPVSGLSVTEEFLVDATGAIDAANAWSAEGEAPRILRLYAPGADNDLSTPDTFDDGVYTLQITENLRGFNGSPGGLPFRTVEGAAFNSILPEWAFSVGADAAPLTIKQSVACAAGGGTFPVNLDDNVALNQEVTIEFNKAVAFETLVGAANLTTLDPFITIPIPLLGGACFGGGATLQAFGVDIGDLYVGLNVPLDPVSMQPEQPAPNLAVIVFMPDPIARPNLVRIRLVDNTMLSGVDVQPNGPFQNYASNSRRRDLQIRSQDPTVIANARNQGQPTPLLGLPPVLSVSGSLPTYTPGAVAGGFVVDPLAMQLQVVVSSPMPMDPTGNGCSVPAGTLVSRSQQPFNFCAAASDFFLNTGYQAGVALARNASVPDLMIVTQPTLPGLAALNNAGMTADLCGAFDTSASVVVGSQVAGNFALSANPINNPSVLGAVADAEIGRYINGIQNILAAPRVNVNTRGVPDTQNGISPGSLFDIGICPCVVGFMDACMGGGFIPQPYGNFLYVIDSDSRELKVFNSYNFQPITTVTGVRSPAGLGLDASASRLYVSNFNDASVQVVNTLPLTPQFHTVVGSVGVEAGPRAISVQGTNESLWVANFGSNSISRVDPNGLTLRANFRDPSMLGPEDVFATERMLGMLLTNAFTVIVPCSLSNSVAIYESDTFAAAENSTDGIIKGIVGGFSTPKGGTWNWRNYIISTGSGPGPGAFVANSSGNTVQEVGQFNFTLGQPVGFPGPPGTRDYRVWRTIAPPGNLMVPSTSSPRDVSAETMSSLAPNIYNLVMPFAGGSANKVWRDAAGVGNPPAVLMISYPDVGMVASYDAAGGIHLNQVSVPGCDLLISYYDQ